jgi:hypothetical protein
MAMAMMNLVTPETTIQFELLFKKPAPGLTQGYNRNHRYHSEQTERTNMHCQEIACARSFDMGLTSTEGQKLELF